MGNFFNFAKIATMSASIVLVPTALYDKEVMLITGAIALGLASLLFHLAEKTLAVFDSEENGVM